MPSVSSAHPCATMASEEVRSGRSTSYRNLDRINRDAEVRGEASLCFRNRQLLRVKLVRLGLAREGESQFLVFDVNIGRLPSRALPDKAMRPPLVCPPSSVLASTVRQSLPQHLLDFVER